MKRSVTIFILLAITWALNIHLQAQCSVSVSSSDTTICIGDSVTITANATGPSTALNSTMAGGNNHRGNMFNIQALNTVTITSFDGHPMGNTTVEIYYKTGTHVGFETTPAAWTLIGTAAVTAQPFGTPTPYPIPVNITIPAGQTYAFYVTSTNTSVSQNYTDGTTVGNVFVSDANIQFLEGTGEEYPFGSPFQPRIWNGVIHYTLPGSFSYSWSTGASTSSITVAPNTSTQYSVDVNIAGCSQMSDSMTIVVNNPVVDLGTDQSACASDSVSLDAGPGFSAYLWSTTEVSQSIIASGPSLGAGNYNYIATVTDDEGCMDTDTIGVTIFALPAVSLTDEDLCNNESLLLDAGNGFSSYDWNTGDTTQTLLVDGTSLGLGAHSFIIAVTDANTCQASDTVTVEVLPHPTASLGIDMSICNTGSLMLDAGPGFAGYLWNNSATTQMINADGSVLGIGTFPYSVMVTDTNGCSDIDTMVLSVISCAGIEDAGPSIELSLYPNPVSDYLYISITSNVENEIGISILNDMGQQVLQTAPQPCVAGTQTRSIDLSSLAPGFYFISFRVNGQVITRKVVVQ